MKKVVVSNGELLDKLSILEIKEKKGFDVKLELSALENEADSLLDNPVVVHLYNILVTINFQLWDIEDAKRNYEKSQDFGSSFVEYARLVYMINDERAKIKKYIDRLSGSAISEIKSHGSY